MNSTARPEPASQLWGIYHTDREYAREIGDPLRTVVEAPTKAAAEASAMNLGFDNPWANPVTLEVARSLDFHPPQQHQTQPTKHQSSHSNMHRPTTAQLRTAIEVLDKLGKRVEERLTHSTALLLKTPRGEECRAQIEARAKEETTRIETVATQLKSWREELLQQQKQSISRHV